MGLRMELGKDRTASWAKCPHCRLLQKQVADLTAKAIKLGNQVKQLTNLERQSGDSNPVPDKIVRVIEIPETLLSLTPICFGMR